MYMNTNEKYNSDGRKHTNKKDPVCIRGKKSPEKLVIFFFAMVACRWNQIWNTFFLSMKWYCMDVFMCVW